MKNPDVYFAVFAIWHIMQHVKGEIGDRFSGASAGSGFNVEDLVVDLDFYITGLTKVQNVKTN